MRSSQGKDTLDERVRIIAEEGKGETRYTQRETAYERMRMLLTIHLMPGDYTTREKMIHLMTVCSVQLHETRKGKKEINLPNKVSKDKFQYSEVNWW